MKKNNFNSEELSGEKGTYVTILTSSAAVNTCVRPKTIVAGLNTAQLKKTRRTSREQAAVASAVAVAVAAAAAAAAATRQSDLSF